MNFDMPKKETQETLVARYRRQREKEALRKRKRLRSGVERHGKRNFTYGVVCAHEEGCDAQAYAIDPLRKREKVPYCRKHYMRSWRAIQTQKWKARER